MWTYTFTPSALNVFTLILSATSSKKRRRMCLFFFLVRTKATFDREIKAVQFTRHCIYVGMCLVPKHVSYQSNLSDCQINQPFSWQMPSLVRRGRDTLKGIFVKATPRATPWSGFYQSPKHARFVQGLYTHLFHQELM